MVRRCLCSISTSLALTNSSFVYLSQASCASPTRPFSFYLSPPFQRRHHIHHLRLGWLLIHRDVVLNLAPNLALESKASPQCPNSIFPFKDSTSTPQNHRPRRHFRPAFPVSRLSPTL